MTYRRNTMAKHSHLTLSDRITIEACLKERMSFNRIAYELGKDPTTVSKEVKNHYIIRKSTLYKPCGVYSSCKHHGDICEVCKFKYGASCKRCDDCYKHCPDFVQICCPRLKKPPYVCNGCEKTRKCTYERHVYNAKHAQEEYEAVRSESRQGIALTEEELTRIDDFISPLVKQGQSIHHICVNNADEIMLDQRTIYKYIDANLLSVGNVDLPRKVRYRPRKKVMVRIDKKCHLGRTYEDFLTFMESNPDLPVVEMDSVLGAKGGKVMLTIFFRNCSVLLAYIRDCNNARSVKDIFNMLDERLGRETFQKLFPVILTDRGSEFSNPLSIECDEYGELRTRVFFCDPQRSNQKGGIEVAHELIRRVLPKGVSINSLTQKDITLMTNHINSYTRKKLGNQTAYNTFCFLYGEETAQALGMSPIPANEINLTPGLLKK